MRRKFLESLMPSYIKQLKLDKFDKSVVILVDSDCHEMGTTMEMKAVNGFVIEIAPQSLKNLALTLAHEMVHVKQMVRGHLKMDGRGATYWRGEKQSKTIAYLDQPWEIEAFSKQELMMRRAFEE